MGITLYAFVYGKLPFHDDNIVVLYDKIRTSPLTFPPVPFVSDDLKDLISLMLEKNPARRITLPEIKVNIYRLHILWFLTSRIRELKGFNVNSLLKRIHHFLSSKTVQLWNNTIPCDDIANLGNNYESFIIVELHVCSVDSGIATEEGMKFMWILE